MPRRSIFSLAAATLILLAAVGDAVAQEVAYSFSLGYAEGDYIFSETSRSAYVSNGFTVRSGRFSAGFLLPVNYQNTPWISSSVIGFVPSGGPAQREVAAQRGKGGGGGGTNQGGSGHGGPGKVGSSGEPVIVTDTTSFSKVGIGDPSARLAVAVVDQPRTSFSIEAGAKFPVASSTSGFGTGQFDFGVGASGSRSVGRASVMASAAYWVLGDMDDLELLNPIVGSLSVGYVAAGLPVGLFISASGSTVVVSGTDPGLSVGFGASRFIRGAHSVAVTGTLGLTESTPAYSVGLSLYIKVLGER